MVVVVVVVVVLVGFVVVFVATIARVCITIFSIIRIIIRTNSVRVRIVSTLCRSRIIRIVIIINGNNIDRIVRVIIIIIINSRNDTIMIRNNIPMCIRSIGIIRVRINMIVSRNRKN